MNSFLMCLQICYYTPKLRVRSFSVHVTTEDDKVVIETFSCIYIAQMEVRLGQCFHLFDAVIYS